MSAVPDPLDYNGGLVVDPSDAATALQVTNSFLQMNNAGGVTSSGMLLSPLAGTLTATIQGNTIAGNDTAQPLGGGSFENFGGITPVLFRLGSITSVNTTPSSLTSPVPWTAYNHITGNGVGVVVGTSIAGGNLSYNDLTGNLAAGIEIVGNPISG